MNSSQVDFNHLAEPGDLHDGTLGNVGLQKTRQLRHTGSHGITFVADITDADRKSCFSDPWSQGGALVSLVYSVTRSKHSGSAVFAVTHAPIIS